MRLLSPILSVVACLGLTVVVLALLPPAPRGEGEPRPTFARAVRIIGTTVYERVVLPRSPSAVGGYRNWFMVVRSATPLLLAGLAIAVAFRAGVLNIGAQGQYIAGAIAATAVALHLPAGSPWLVIAHLLSAMAAGALLAALAAALERWRNVPVVLSTLLLNFVALEVLRYLLQGPMRSIADDGTPREPQSDELPAAAVLREFFPPRPGQQGLVLGFFIALAAAAALAFLLRRTTFGFRLRAVGANPEAARFAGMNVGRIATASLALSGALAGLAGAVQVAGSRPYILLPGLGTDGVGFTAIAVALLGRLAPAGVVFSALFFGVLHVAFMALQESDLEVQAATAQAVQGMLVLAILVVTSPRWAKDVSGLWKRRSAPAD